MRFVIKTISVEKVRDAYESLIGKREPLWGPRCRWIGNIKMVFEEIWFEDKFICLKIRSSGKLL